MGRWQQIVKTSGAPNRPVWPFSLAELSRTFVTAANECGLGHMKPVLYELRQGGASEDLLRGTRDLNGVFRRGRWRSRSSVRRYGKEAKLLAELGKVPEPLLQYGRFIEANLERLFDFPGHVPPVPTV